MRFILFEKLTQSFKLGDKQISSFFLAGPSAHPNGFDITFHVKEKGFLTSSTGTHIGNNEGSMVG